MEKDNATKPGNAIKYCFKCGSSKFIFDGDRSFQCQKCNFHFYINSSAAVAAIITNEEGKVLLTIRAHEPNKGFLDLPGGFVDPMESAEDAVKREIKEELNLEVISCNYLTSFPNEYVFSDFSVFTTDLGYFVKVKDFNSIEADDDITGHLFFDYHEIDWDKICADSMKSILKFYFNSPHYTKRKA